MRNCLTTSLAYKARHKKAKIIMDLPVIFRCHKISQYKRFLKRNNLNFLLLFCPHFYIRDEEKNYIIHFNTLSSGKLYYRKQDILIYDYSVSIFGKESITCKIL